MMDLEDLYDVSPPQAELVGGEHDGKVITIPSLLMQLVMPDHPEILHVAEYPCLYPEEFPVTVYRRTGSVRDDGTHVYAVAGAW